MADEPTYEPLEGPEGGATRPLVVVSREEWGARPPKATVPLQHPLTRVMYTFTTPTRTVPCLSREECIHVVRTMQAYHMDEQGMMDIAYNFLVGRDGTIYEGRGWHAKSSKLLKYNPQLYNKRLDIAFIGDFSKDMIPAVDMVEGAINLGVFGIENNYLRDPYKVLDIRYWRDQVRAERAKKLPPAKTENNSGYQSEAEAS